MNFLLNLYKRIKTISSFSDFTNRITNVFILIYKISIGHYGEKYWEKQRLNRPLSKEEELFINLKTKLRKIEKLNSTDQILKARKKLNSIKKLISKLDNKTLTNIFFNELDICNKNIVLQSYPRDMIITLTNKCNLNCIMCFANESNFEINDRAFEDIKKILPYLKIVRWMGGEVFLYDKFNILFKEANKHSIKQEIITNGLLLNKTLTDEIVDNNVDLALSIDGTTKDVYEKIRVNGKFEKILENLQYLKEKRKKTKNNNTFIRLNIVIFKENFFQIVDFIEFCKKYDINMVEFTPLIRDIRNKELDIFIGNINKDIINEINKQTAIASQKAKEYGIILNNYLPNINFIKKTKEEYHTFNFNSGEESLYCHIPWKKLFISSNGNVYPNCFCSIPIGNINEESLFKLWNNKKMQEYRKRIIEKNIKDFCSIDCFYERMPKNYKKSC